MSLAGLLQQYPALTDYFNSGQDIYLSTSLGNYVDGIDAVPLQISSTLLPSVDGSDMISELPDSILCHILSFLPTVYAIRTSCLSKRWRFIWMSVASLDFQDMYYASQYIKYYSDFIFIRSFVKFVNEVFTRHTNPCIRRFSLQLMCPYSTVVVDSWISAAITHNVEELTLFMRNACFLPQIFFSSKTLVTVKFHSGINFEVPESVSLPSLKTLHLQKIPCLTDAGIERILSGCPVLEDLVIDRSKDDDIESLSISSSSLKSFKLINNRGNEEDYDIVIDAPQLKFLYLRDDCAANYIQVKNFSSVVNATFEYMHCCQVLAQSYEEEMVQIMQKRNVEFCTMISRTLLKTLVGTSNNKLLCCANKLTKLVMRCCGADLKVFPDILKFLPNLEVLVLDFYKDCSLTIQFEVLEEETDEISCLKYSLKKVELRSCKGTEVEMQAVEYFLKNARVLNEIRLRTEKGSEIEAEVLKKLLMFTRCSDACQIVVS